MMLNVILNVGSGDNPHSLFSQVVSYLKKLGLIDLERECVHDIGLIVAGSKPQPMHFDVASTPDNSKCYDEVMALPNSPAVILLGFSGPIRIGVEKSQVKMISSSDLLYPKCQIEGGVEGEDFVVVGEVEQASIKKKKEYKDEMYVIESEGGFMFKGDFFHAGVPSAALDQEVEMEAWNSVHEILMAFSLEQTEWDSEIAQAKVFERLMEVPHLETITRLHCMVKPKRDEEFMISSGEVGFETVDQDDCSTRNLL
jgi:hypothetical protein